MRNIYDQYEQPENRLTHALASTLANDPKLMRPFLSWLGIKQAPALTSLKIVEQQIPGEITSTDESDSKGLPDICILNDDSWAVIFESKVQSKVNKGQLKRHVKTVKRYGYEVAALVVIAVDPKKGNYPEDIIYIQWRELWVWFRKICDKSEWAKRLVDYMQVFENRMISKDYSIRGTITMFDGIKFDKDNPYTYSEAKRIIRLLGDELQGRKDLKKIGVDPNGSRRSAITGREGNGVWDFLPLQVAKHAKQFTDYPHLTLGIGRIDSGSGVTIPNGVKGRFRTKLKEIELEGFRDLMLKLEKRLRPVIEQSKGAKPIVYVLQRHYLSQRSSGIEDGRLDVDLRTLLKGKSGSVKYQPEWIDTIYTLLTEKKSNIQFGVSARFNYKCKLLRSPEAVDLFAKTWIAISPLLKFVLN